MNVKKIYEATIWIFLGCFISMAILHLRFNNELLRRELILFMQEGNGYFVGFIGLYFAGLVILIALYLLFYRTRKKKESTETTGPVEK